MYTVIGGVASRTFRVLWMLEELGADYEHRPASPHAEEVTAHSASGKIPVLLDGDAALTDSTAILTYLADKHGALTSPAGSLERAGGPLGVAGHRLGRADGGRAALAKDAAHRLDQIGGQLERVHHAALFFNMDVVGRRLGADQHDGFALSGLDEIVGDRQTINEA